MFSFVNGVVLQRLPYRKSDRLVSLASFSPQFAAPTGVSPGDFVDWQAENRSFGEMVAFPLAIALSVVAERLG